MPIRIGELTPRDEARTVTIRVLGERTTVTYFPNRVNQEDEPVIPGATDDDDPRRREQAATSYDVCRIVKAWDWEGPVVRQDGTILVAEGAPVPLEFDVVRCIPLRLLSDLLDALLDDAFPNRRGGRSGRRG